MVVIEHEHHLVRAAGKIVDQLGQQLLERWESWRVRPRNETRCKPRMHLVQRSRHVTPEPDRVVVHLVERYPRHFSSSLAAPVGQHRRLPEASRCADQRQCPIASFVEQCAQADTIHEACGRSRDLQLGGQEPASVAGAHRAGCMSTRLSHRRHPTAGLRCDLGVRRSSRGGLATAQPVRGFRHAARRVHPQCYFRVTTRGRSHGRLQAVWYEIRIEDGLDQSWATWFDGMAITYDTGGITVIRGQVVDQAALHGVLTRVRDLGLDLVSVRRIGPDEGKPVDE